MERRHIIIGTSGHIDHGKTRLVGRLTETNTDRLPEERARGISIDLGFANWTEGDFQFGVIDVPGHERFVRNMVAGATGMNLGMLVIAADDSVMPQTREHLEIMDLLGLETGLIAVTKIDLVEPDFVEFVTEDVRDLVSGTFLEGCPVIPVSSETGEGFNELRQTLLEIAGKISQVSNQPVFRMPIDRVFTVTGHGSIVTGSVLSGAVAAGDTIELLPEQREVRVRSVQNHGASTDGSGARQRTAVNLAGIKTEELRRGQELATTGFLTPTSRLIVDVKCLTSSPTDLKDRVELNLHLGTTEIPVRLLCGKEPIAAGTQRVVELRTKEPIIATWGQRFILRRISPAVTVGGGTILDPGVPPLKRLRSISDHVDGLTSQEPAERLAAFLRHVDAVPKDPLVAMRRAGVPSDQYESLIGQLTDEGILQNLGRGDSQVLMHRDRRSAIGKAVLRTICGTIAKQQPRRSLPEQTLLTACRGISDVAVLQTMMQDLIRSKDLVRVGSNIGPADAQVQLTKKQRAARNQMLETIQQAGLAPPTKKELIALTGLKQDAVSTLLNLCVEDELLVNVSEDFLFAPEAMEDARKRCVAAFSELDGKATLAQIRDAWEVTRKFAVPLCEWFDSHGLTRREEDVRVAGPNLSEPLFGMGESEEPPPADATA
ncbi:MAG: selenocysteine-specific translation elongation factor [Planctomycetaceae bacterium]